MIEVKCKTKNFEFEINNSSQSVKVVNIEDVSKEEMEKDQREFFGKYRIISVTDIPVQKPKGRVPRAKKIPARKGIPGPLERLNKELADLEEEFTLSDIGDLFEKEGYHKKKIMDNAYHDIDTLIEKNKIIYIDGTKPRKYKIVSRDTSDLE